MPRLTVLASILIFASLIARVAFALPEAELEQRYPEAVAFFNSSPLQEFAGKEGAVIRYKVFAQSTPADAIVISNGYHEDMGLYSELIFDLFHEGYSIYIMDHRGQGLSDRLIANHERGYIDHFEYFSTDLHSFVTNIVRKHQNGKLHLLAHSMGSVIALSLLEKYKKDFSDAVLSAPMLKINTGDWNEVTALEYSRFKCLLGHCKEFAQDPIDPKTISFETNPVTYSEARYKIRISRFDTFPPGSFFAPTYGWIKEAIAGSRATRMRASQVQTPILILQATDDTVVEVSAQDRFCKQVRSCQLVRLKSKHSIFIGPDATRTVALQKALQFFQSKH
jgi:lysophospholipase